MSDQNKPEGSIAYLLGSIDSKVDQLLASTLDHEKRIGDLEHNRSKVLGACAVVSLAVTGAWQWFIGNK
jgi:hypothetical protein